jgi:hypothetical protein
LKEISQANTLGWDIVLVGRSVSMKSAPTPQLKITVKGDDYQKQSSGKLSEKKQGRFDPASAPEN